ncbi:carbohydrate-binding domain-containing protein [Micromonospora sp. M12]
MGGAIRTATGTPVPASGTHASLWSNSSYATTSISGSGRVLIGAIGDDCQGWPTVRVTVDGVNVGQTTIVSATGYGTYPVGTAVGAGQHTVRIQFINDFRADSCDRNVHVAYARMETAGATDPKFSFAVLPDTQQEVLNSSDSRFLNRTNWLAQNRSALDLRFVTSSGDVVNWDTRTTRSTSSPVTRCGRSRTPPSRTRWLSATTTPRPPASAAPPATPPAPGNSSATPQCSTSTSPSASTARSRGSSRPARSTTRTRPSRPAACSGWCSPWSCGPGSRP